ncbi:MAG: hypothetical protein K2X39_03785 [Silvanigrellaceae bacterium]|nr:hypothetical protein [Silvanigrellaceae bacterium]
MFGPIYSALKEYDIDEHLQLFQENFNSQEVTPEQKAKVANTSINLVQKRINALQEKMFFLRDEMISCSRRIGEAEQEISNTDNLFINCLEKGQRVEGFAPHFNHYHSELKKEENLYSNLISQYSRLQSELEECDQEKENKVQFWQANQ